MIEPSLFGGNFFKLVNSCIDQKVETAELVSVVVLLRNAKHRTGLGHVERRLVEEEGSGRDAAVALAVVKTPVAVEVFDWAQFGRVRQGEAGTGG